MPTTLRSQIVPRERVLAMGSEGTGKTSAIIHVARRCPDTKFYVLDSDGAMARMLTGANAALDVANGGNISYRLTIEWSEYEASLADFQQQMGADDWLVVDMIGPAWEAVQDYFSERVFGRGVEQFFLEARASAKKGSAFDGRKDWTVIKKLYKSWLQSLVLRTPGHVYVTSPVAKVEEDDEKHLRQLFGRFGVKPQGEKHMGHAFHTILLFKAPRPGVWTMSTIKDREREVVEDEAIGDDWSKSYLMGVAGWRPKALA